MPVLLKNLQKKIPIPSSQIKRALESAVLKLKRFSQHHSLSIVFVGPQRMRRLNKEYLGHDYVTDVLTFDLGEMGEIIICPQVAAANARIYQSSTDKELILYAVHGLLHLAGYDDHASADISKMRKKERELLGAGHQR